jgi:hypothetical protein
VRASARVPPDSEEPSLPTWIAAGLPSDVTIQYVDQGDNVGGFIGTNAL